MRYINIKLISFIIIFISLFFTFLAFQAKENTKFLGSVSKCNSAESSWRFSCYRSVIDKYHKGNLAGLLTELRADKHLKLDSIFSKKEEVSYAIFGTNCHTFYHAVGDFIAVDADSRGIDVKAALNSCPSTCTGGCVMGLYKRVALENNFSSDLLKRFYNICRGGERNQCSHEIGHVLQDKYFSSILKPLDELSEKEYGLKPEREYRYVTSATIDFDAPFEECREIIPENKWAQCFTGIGHNLFLFSEFSPDGYESMVNECNKIAGHNKDECLSFLIYRIGINKGATKFLSDKFDEGRKVCADTVAVTGREDLKHHCYVGIGGGIGLFADSEFASLEINEKNTSDIEKQLMYLANLCDGSEGEFINYCLRGLLGTGFVKLYSSLNVYHEKIEQVILEIDAENDFEVVG